MYNGTENNNAQFLTTLGREQVLFIMVRELGKRMPG